MAVSEYSKLINHFTNTQNLAEGSIRTYKHHLNQFLRFLGDKKLTRTEVAKYINQLLRENKKGN